MLSLPWLWYPYMSEGSRISPNDLRLKLMRKSLKQVHRAVGEHGKMDQHKTLSKTIQLSASHNMLQQRPTERSRFKGSRGFSTPIDFADPRQVPSAREASASRAGWLLSKDALSRPIGSTPFIAKGPSETSKPVTHLALMRNFGQKSYHAVWLSCWTTSVSCCQSSIVLHLHDISLLSGFSNFYRLRNLSPLLACCNHSVWESITFISVLKR